MYTDSFFRPFGAWFTIGWNFPRLTPWAAILPPLCGYPNLAGSILTRSSLAGGDTRLLSHVEHFLDFGNHSSLLVFYFD